MKKEKGFVLVTALVLLAILTLLGISSSYKSVVEIKVSRLSGDVERAYAAANSGLTQMYWYWAKDGNLVSGGLKEFTDLVAYIDDPAGFTSDVNNVVPGVYQGDLAPINIDSDLSDSAIQGNTNIRVYTMSSSGVTDAYAWKAAAAGHDPQVAVWVATFDDTYSAPAYPYATHVDLGVDGEMCPGGCRMVTYALGRSGNARRLLRETQSVIDQKLRGVSAMTNAPAGNSETGVCATGTTGSANGDIWDSTEGENGSMKNAVVQSTQAPYKIGAIPSGTALASNTSLASANQAFESGTGSQLGATFAQVPLLMYSGHDTKYGFKTDWATLTHDATANNLPDNLLPLKLTNAPLLGTEEQVNYFTDAGQQLFNMDSYRWAAEQFTCQDPTKADGQYGNGEYCSKGERLRLALVAMGYKAFAPVTGRLTIAHFQYNISQGIPMFGLVRVLVPAEQSTSPLSTATCDDKAYILHRLLWSKNTNANDVITGINDDTSTGSDGDYDFENMQAVAATNNYVGGNNANNATMDTPAAMIDPYTNGGRYGFTIGDGAEPSKLGNLGENARITVYGSLLIDFFADYDIRDEDGEDSGTAGLAFNTVFEPVGGERILNPLESPAVFLGVNFNLMINPTMPRFESHDPYAFPTAYTGSGLTTAGRINMVDLTDSSTNPVNLASPVGGYFPWSEGMLPQIGEGPAGSMRLMSRGSVADNTDNLGLLKMLDGTGAGIGNNATVNAVTADMVTLLNMANPRGGTGKEHHVLKYYYSIMEATTDPSDDNGYPMAPWPSDFTNNNFCLGKQDCGTSNPNATSWNNHMGDKAHLLFPTAYMHGWKVAFAALDIKADDWNEILSGNGGSTPGITDAGGLYDQITDGCTLAGSGGATDGCLMGLPFNFGADDGALDREAVETIQAEQALYFYVTEHADTGYGLMDHNWQDIPSTMYSGGLLNMNAHSNMNGIVYTPGPLRWAPGVADYDTGVHMSYITGSIITGYGAYAINEEVDDRYVLVFDMQSLDNVNTNKNIIILRRYDWQMLN